MDYIVCNKPGQLQLGKKTKPIPGPGEALLEIRKVGICGTDLHAYGGNQAFFTYPRILGHELAGKIIDIDINHHLKVGEKVIVLPYISCGNCIACQLGKTNCCTNIQVLGVHTDGGMQQQIVVRNDLLIPAPDLSYEEMAIVEPLAIGAHALRRAEICAGEFVVVMGCGPIGLGIIKQAQIAGAKVIALDMNDKRLEYASEHMGTDHTINISNDPLKVIMQITDNDLANVVFDATGNQKALETGPQYMAHGGRYVLVGLSKGNLTFNHPEIHAKEATILCSRNATFEDFQKVISILGRKEFLAASFITHKVPYQQMIAQFDHWLRPDSEVIKAMVDF